jgi:hypothetical protein
LRFRSHRRPPGAFPSDRSIRDDLFPFHVPVATPDRFGSCFVRPKPPDCRSPPWLTVATIGLW